VNPTSENTDAWSVPAPMDVTDRLAGWGLVPPADRDLVFTASWRVDERSTIESFGPDAFTSAQLDAYRRGLWRLMIVEVTVTEAGRHVYFGAEVAVPPGQAQADDVLCSTALLALGGVVDRRQG
jgi:hypothetical protein